MRRARRIAILLYGILETFLFAGNIFGWTALHYMLKSEGIYQYVCEDQSAIFVKKFTNTSEKTVSGMISDAAMGKYGEKDIYSVYLPNSSLSNADQVSNVSITMGGQKKGCETQDRILNLAFTIGSFCIGSSACVWGFLLEKWGLRTVRICINGLITTGTVLLSVTASDTSYLVFPALAFMCLAGVPLRMVNMQIANLFPKQRATIICLYSGAFSASASVFVFMKYAFDAGLRFEWVCFILVIFSIIMLPATLFLLPPDIPEPGTEKKGLFISNAAEVAGISPSIWGKFTLIPGSPDFRRKPEISVILQTPDKAKLGETTPTKNVSSCNVPLKESLFTSDFWLHCYWFCWLLLYTVIYVGTLTLWTARLPKNSATTATFSEIYGLFQVTCLFLAPLGGVFMDWRIQQASQEPKPEVRRLQVMRSAFWPMLITTGTQAVVQICKFFNNQMAVYISVVFVTFLRAFLIATATAYIRIRFPADHFSKLLGIMSSASAIASLFQFPYYVWETGSPNNVVYVNAFYTICLLIAFVHPLLLLVTKLQKYFIENEKKIANKYTKFT